MKLLLDNNLSHRIAKALDVLFPEHTVVALSDKFPANASDEHWISVLDHEGGWAVLTRDLRIRTRPHERAAMDRSRIVFFFLAGSWKDYNVPETAARLIRSVSNMALQTSIVERGRFELPVNAGSKLRPLQD